MRSEEDTSAIILMLFSRPVCVGKGIAKTSKSSHAINAEVISIGIIAGHPCAENIAEPPAPRYSPRTRGRAARQFGVIRFVIALSAGLEVRERRF